MSNACAVCGYPRRGHAKQGHDFTPDEDTPSINHRQYLALSALRLCVEESRPTYQWVADNDWRRAMNMKHATLTIGALYEGGLVDRHEVRTQRLALSEGRLRDSAPLVLWSLTRDGHRQMRLYEDRYRAMQWPPEFRDGVR